MDGTYHNGKKSPIILCATSGVDNAGIDSSNFRLVFRIDMLPSIVNLRQEKGRYGQHPLASSDNYRYVMCLSLEYMIFLFRGKMDPRELVIENSYHHHQLNYIFYIGRTLASKGCYAVALEYGMGNPLKFSLQLPTCGNCEKFENKPLFPLICRCIVLEYILTSWQMVYVPSLS